LPCRGATFQESTLPSPFSDVESDPVQPTQATTLQVPSPSKVPAPLSPVSTSAGRVASSQERISPAPLPQRQDPALSLATPKAASPTPPHSPSSAVDSQPVESAQEDALVETTAVPAGDLSASSHDSPEDVGAHVEEQSPSKKSVPQEQPAKVIHLGSKEEQEKHLRDIERAQESARLRERKEDEILALSSAMHVGDAASSPSSTTGAYSTSTPKPPPHSPDTSPDAEYAMGSRGIPRTATPEEEIVGLEKRDGMEDVEIDMGTAEESSITPDAQLKLEEKQANRPTESLGESNGTNHSGIGSPSTKTNVESQATILDKSISSGEAIRKNPTDESAAENLSSIDVPAPFKTPKRPSVNTNTKDLDVEMRDVTQSATTPATVTPASTTRSTHIDPPTRRMTTRVASGAIRQKSVSEILGETPKPCTPQADRRASQNQVCASPFNLRSTATTPVEDKSRHSMVVFSKKEKSLSPMRGSRYEPDGYLALKGASEDPEKDYLRPLFLHQAYLPPRAVALTDLITEAKKTVSTMNMYSNLREGQDYRILRRIYQLQNANKWSLRQMAKFPDPAPAITHQDHLLAEMKWMRTDFREEGSWKRAAARRLAGTCAAYVAASQEEKEHMRIKAKIPPKSSSIETQIQNSGDEIPDLVHTTSMESSGSLPDEEMPDIPPVATIAPAALFSLGYDDVVFELDPTPAGEGILNELPFYDMKPLQPSPFHNSADPFNLLIPVSKYSSGKLVPKPSGPPRKRSRYDYESEEDESALHFPQTKRRASEVSMFLSPARRSPRHKELAPEETDVALFNPINRHIRDRLHANHAFRPPSEFQMPSTNFFEHRIPSQWTWDEDQKLRVCVKKFSYNWSLIAMELQAFSQPSMYVAASERRTPWECFERWYQLEGLPNDMDKTTYFRTYRSRIEAANKTVAAQAQAAQQQQSQTPGAVQPMRRRPSTQPYRVERRRDSRYINMVDAIRKLARKRETALHRQQECKSEHSNLVYNY
jgi:chromatin modification-related protein VID21